MYPYITTYLRSRTNQSSPTEFNNPESSHGFDEIPVGLDRDGGHPKLNAQKVNTLYGRKLAFNDIETQAEEDVQKILDMSLYPKPCLRTEGAPRVNWRPESGMGAVADMGYIVRRAVQLCTGPTALGSPPKHFITPTLHSETLELCSLLRIATPDSVRPSIMHNTSDSRASRTNLSPDALKSGYTLGHGMKMNADSHSLYPPSAPVLATYFCITQPHQLQDQDDRVLWFIKFWMRMGTSSAGTRKKVEKFEAVSIPISATGEAVKLGVKCKILRRPICNVSSPMRSSQAASAGAGATDTISAGITFWFDTSTFPYIPQSSSLKSCQVPDGSIENRENVERRVLTVDVVVHQPAESQRMTLDAEIQSRVPAHGTKFISSKVQIEDPLGRNSYTCSSRSLLISKCAGPGPDYDLEPGGSTSALRAMETGETVAQRARDRANDPAQNPVVNALATGYGTYHAEGSLTIDLRAASGRLARALGWETRMPSGSSSVQRPLPSLDPDATQRTVLSCSSFPLAAVVVHSGQPWDSRRMDAAYALHLEVEREQYALSSPSFLIPKLPSTSDKLRGYELERGDSAPTSSRMEAREMVVEVIRGVGSRERYSLEAQIIWMFTLVGSGWNQCLGSRASTRSAMGYHKRERYLRHKTGAFRHALNTKNDSEVLVSPTSGQRWQFEERTESRTRWTYQRMKLDPFASLPWVTIPEHSSSNIIDHSNSLPRWWSVQTGGNSTG
ncbi:hypothetical protein BDN72DRAFT_858815 [Pluteus cervinus]|uniref:Uncharacterized protein n=1 Tax=Pluteus cervinus TaxID=181527 RepID=A0ACD3ARB1_9AGAR|nr:hypothetical protein BDN72DRAFT_858815 [Pluteus cervinus]